MRRFRRGDYIIYYEPAPRRPAYAQTAGNDSTRMATHFMTVRESSQKGTLVLQAHSGQLIVTHNDSPQIRRARWWERWFQGDQFPQLDAPSRPVLINGTLRRSVM